MNTMVFNLRGKSNFPHKLSYNIETKREKMIWKFDFYLILFDVFETLDSNFKK